MSHGLLVHGGCARFSSCQPCRLHRREDCTIEFRACAALPFSLVLVLLLAGGACRRETPAPPPPATAPVASNTPREGGRLVRRLESDIRTLSYILHTEEEERQILSLIYDPLVAFDQNLTPIPGIAHEVGDRRRRKVVHAASRSARDVQRRHAGEGERRRVHARKDARRGLAAVRVVVRRTRSRADEGARRPHRARRRSPRRASRRSTRSTSAWCRSTSTAKATSRRSRKSSATGRMC